MRYLISTLFIMTLFTSCIKFNGNLEVTERLELYHEQNGRLYKRSLPTDNYPASFQVFNKNTVELYFDLRDGRKITTRMLLPHISDRPNTDGDFFISSSKMSQIHDIKGNINTVVTQNPTIFYGNDICHEWVNRQVCRRVCDARGCYNRCTWEYVYAQGYQNVEFQESIHRKTLTLNFINPESLMSHGKFNGQNREVRRNYLYKSQCYIR